jgi:oxygen-dependent protoporphyrinogen oxidase
MKRIAIIGGGVSGLSTAFALEKRRKRGAGLEYVLFESSPRLGGVLHSEHADGFIIEAGPDSFLTEKPWAADLCRELGLGDQLISSNDAERKTYIVRGGCLMPLPDGLMFMVPTNLRAAFFSPLFSLATKLRMLREWFFRPTPDSPEATAAQFVERHYGREMVVRLADPLLAGVYGSSADELSASAVLPRLVEIEAKQGSLGRAMLASRKLRGTQRPLFTSLKHGMQQMINGLETQIPESSRRLNAPVETVLQESGKWLVVCSGRTFEFEAVIVSLPAHAGARLLARIPEIAGELEQIAYSSSITVSLAYGPGIRTSLPAGFGFLVPRTEGKRILACTFVHQKFPNRAPTDGALLRCFLGGSRDEQILACPDQAIEHTVRSELQQILGLTAQPLFVEINRWPKSMAQYGLGYKPRVERIRQLIARTPGIALAGNAYGGIGISDCIRSGSEAAAKIMADLGVEPPSAA